MSDDEFEMRLIEKRNRERLIAHGVRYDPIQKGALSYELQDKRAIEHRGPKKKGGGRKSFHQWFKGLSKVKPV